CWFPLLVSTVAFGYGAPGLQAANFLVLFGALDRLGGFFVLASIREFAPFVDAIVLAGVAGTAITADLGARKIREELDALQVLGVDPVKNLVVPRFLALMLITGLLDISISARKRGTTRFLRSEEHTSELQSLRHLVCRLLLEKKKKRKD